MRLRDISASEAAARLITGDINIDLGVAAFGVQSALPDVQRVFYQLYGDYELRDEASPADFRVAVQSPKSLRRWYNRRSTSYSMTSCHFYLYRVHKRIRC